MDDSTNLDIGLERALAIAHRSLASRDRTVREVRAALERKGVSEVVIEETLDELARAGLVDDARFARRFAEDKRELERWGAARIERELE
ncbi:MAG: RecX family transcriptional regulator, partial [Thermoleophilaceae bacterium]|nr:RecX family transcriptional regulator [Thermoleophilaceae bacterium]